jgi:ABC-type nickel/cobalt efflux system permease component RcnA
VFILLLTAMITTNVPLKRATLLAVVSSLLSAVVMITNVPLTLVILL